MSFYINSPSVSQNNSRSTVVITSQNWSKQLELLSVFPKNQGLSFMIFNENWTKHLSITTWNRDDAVRLLNSPGLYHIDLSSLWHAKFNSSLPNYFLLKIEAFSTNGQESAFNLDSISLNLTPITLNLVQKDT